MDSVKERQKKLYSKWEKLRDYPYFVKDGILNYEKWDSISPKIMFLLKETADNFTEIADKQINITKGNGTHFWWNICYWKYLINCFYNNEEPYFISQYELPEILFNNSILDSIAYVNVKKQCDNLTKSNNNDIYQYAKTDRDLLAEQIDLINPNIIFCSKITFNSYKHIYGQDIEKINEICSKHNDRLILNFRHPSFFQISGGRETIFNDLKRALDNGNVLKHFNWKNNIGSQQLRLRWVRSADNEVVVARNRAACYGF